MQKPRVLTDALVPLTVGLVGGTCESFSPGIFFAGCTVLLLAAWTIRGLVRIIFLAIRGAWTTCALYFLMVSAALPIAGAFLFVAGDYVHLGLLYPFYRNRIAAAGGKTISFDWGGTGFAGIAVSDTTLVYDPQGAVLVETLDKNDPDLAHLYRSVWHLVGPFYVVKVSQE